VTLTSRVLFFAIILMLSSLMPAVSQSQTPPPHLIIGFVWDSDGNDLYGATIYTNSTNQSVMTLTDALGRYTAEVTDYHTGENISVTAIYYGHKASTVIVCNNDPSQMVNLTLALVSRVFQGYVSLPDGSAARNFPLNMTNIATGESRIHLTNMSGRYRVEMVGYSMGYSVGDGVAIFSDFNGFYGSNSSVITNETVRTLDLRVHDIQPPVIILRAAPPSVRVGESFVIDVGVSDNYKVEGVFIHYADVHGTEFTEEMQQSGGNPPGRNITIPAQTDIGQVLYHINATDGFNYTKLPGNPGQRFNVTVYDDEDPIITHTPLSSIEAGLPRDIVTVADDNVAVDAVTLWLWEVGGTGFTAIQMVPNGEPDEFNATIPSQDPGTLRYYITVNDTSDNTDRYPTSGNVSVSVVDSIAPVITHSPINSAHVFDPLNFTAQVDDLVGVSSVWMNMTDENGFTDNRTMTNWGGNMWSWVNATGQTIPGVMFYKIWASDASGNLRSVPPVSSYQILITDNNTPIITHTPVQSNEVFEPVNITVRVTDDVAVTNVTLVYTNVTNTTFRMKGMTLSSGTAQDGTYAADIPPQGELGYLHYYINATDGTNNISHPALTGPHNVTIEDTTPPEVKPPDVTVAVVTQAFIGQPITPDMYVNHLPNVTDNYMVNHVVMYYRPVGNLTWLQFYMSSSDADARGNGTYTATLPPQTQPGHLTFYFRADDTSGNNATLPETTPKLNPYSIWIKDGQAPEVYYEPPASIPVNHSLMVRVNATDDQEVTGVDLHYKGTVDAVFRTINMTRASGDSYVAFVPAQMTSGQLQLYLSAHDGENTNHTGVLVIDVINEPPTITHTNRTNAPVYDLVDIIATVEDDVRVESVELAYRVVGATTYNIVQMDSEIFGLYETTIGPFSEFLVLEYHLTAYDAENETVWPAPGEDALLPILDTIAPVIEHEPIDDLVLNERPIIVATVTDDVEVVSVTVVFRNSTTVGDTTAILFPVAGNESQYAALLGGQPLGQFSYHIEASDGSNTARFPGTSEITVEVTSQASDDWALILLVLIILLLIVAVALVLMHRRKTIKRKDDSSQTGKEDA